MIIKSLDVNYSHSDVLRFQLTLYVDIIMQISVS